MKLGTLLLRDAVINLGQLEAALRAQILYGGRLGTNLVELDFLEVDTLGLYLSKLHGLPVATAERFRTVPRRVIEAFPASLAERFTAFPLGFEVADADLLAVALAVPDDQDALEALEDACGQRIAPYVAAELRILHHLEKHYGITRTARYLRDGDEAPPPSSRDERRRTRPAGGIEMPGPVRLEPRKKQARDTAAEPGAKPECTYLNCCDALDSARHRDEIADALIAFTIGRFEAAAAFLVRRQNAIGWKAQSARRPDASAPMPTLSLPLGGTSVLQAAHDAARPYRGAFLAAGRPVEQRLWDALSVEHEPEEVLVVPVLVKSKVVNLFYAHPFPGRRIKDQHVGELAELAVRASDAYVRLIQAARGED